MRTFLGIAAGLTLASGVALTAASGQQVERRVVEAPPQGWALDLAPAEQEGQNIVRQLAVLEGRGVELGISIRDLDEQQAKSMSGVAVEEVRDGSAAAKAGLKKGDILTDFDGERVRSARQLTRLVEETPDGRTVKTTIVRDGKRVELSVTPERAMAGNRHETFEFALPPGRMEGMFPPEAESRRFFYDMHPPDGGNRIFRHFEGRGRLGIGIQDLTPQLGEYFGVKGGVLVTSVQADTPAAKAGLKAGDVITSIDGQPVGDPGQLVERVHGANDGAELSIGYVRDRKAATAKATLPPREKPKAETRGEPI
jgi:serine protease Do